MAYVNGARHLNSSEPLPSSILVTRVANADDAGDFNQASFNQLLQESLGNDEYGNPNLGSDVDVNHKLISIIVKAGIDPFLEDARINPFHANGSSAKECSQFISCLDVIRTAVEKAPGVIHVRLASDEHAEFQDSSPLYAWLLPRLLVQLTPRSPKLVQEALLGTTRSVLNADSNAVTGITGENLTKFLLRCISAMLQEASSNPESSLEDSLPLTDASFTEHLWDFQAPVGGLAALLHFSSIRSMLQAATLLLAALADYVRSDLIQVQYKQTLVSIQEILEDFVDEAADDTVPQSMLDDLQHLSLRSIALRPRLQSSKAEVEEWPDMDRARKRPRLSDAQQDQVALDSYDRKLARRLTQMICGTESADFVGLNRTAPSYFKQLPEEQQCNALRLLGQTICQLSFNEERADICSACSGELTQERASSAYAEEFLKTLLALIPSMSKGSRSRVTAMITLRQILRHSSSLSDLKLAQSAAGEWCLQSLRSSSRDLRIAATSTLQVYVMQHEQDAALTWDNRVVALDSLQTLWSKQDAALQETAILGYTSIALVVGEEELNLILLRLVECLGHTNSYLNGLVYAEIQQLAQSLQISPAILFRPFWRTLGVVVARLIAARPTGLDQLCEILGMQLPGLMLMVEEHALPYLVLHQHIEITEQFAQAHGPSSTTFDICTNPRNLAGILSCLLSQSFPDAEEKIMALLVNVHADFATEDLAGWLAHVPIQVSCSLLKTIGDSGQGKSSRTYHALQLVAQIESQKAGHQSSSRKSEIMGSFLERNILAIVSHFTVSLNDRDAKEPKLEKKRSVAALGEIAKLGKSRILVALPQICACLRNALDDSDLRDVAFEAWGTIVKSLHADDLVRLIDQTFAIIVKYWEGFNTATQRDAHDLVADILKRHPALVREVFETLPSLSSIPIMAKFEAEIGTLKRQMDERHQTAAFVPRLQDETESVVGQALLELVPLLRSKQDLLHRSILREQPDEFVAQLTRALLDSCVRFQSNNDICTLCAQCLGSIGCLDANRIETIIERKSIVILSNFGRAEETVNFILFFLENILVTAFLSAPTTRAQGFLGWAMQELLKLCQDEDLMGPRIRHGPSVGTRRWNDLPESVRNTLIPFRTSKYHLQNVQAPEKHVYPYFTPGMRHKDWLRGMVKDFLNRAPGNNQGLIFNVCSRIISGQDISIAAFLLPFAVLNLIVSGVEMDARDIVVEIMNILQLPLDGHDRKVQDDIRLCSQTVFEFLDYIQRWLQQRKRQCSTHAMKPDRGTSDLKVDIALAEVRNVEMVLDQIPPDILSQRAIECNSYARALFHWEQYIRRPKEDSKHDEDLARLQDIYAQIDEPDGIEGISAQMHLVDVQGRVIEHKKAGRWTAAQSWYQMNLANQPENIDMQKNLMECLKESGQQDLLLDRYEAMAADTKAHLRQLRPYAVEAAWMTGRWKELSRLLTSEGGDGFSVHLGHILLSIDAGYETKTDILLNDLAKNIAIELTPSAITSLQNCHDTMLRLHIVEDVRLLKDTTVDTRQHCNDVMAKRLSVLGSNVGDKQYVLGVRRAVMQICKNVFRDSDIASQWLQTARLARKAKSSAQAFDAVLKASSLGERSAAIEEAKLIWQDGQHRKAIQTLTGAIDSGAFVAYDDVAEEGPVTLTTAQQSHQNQVTAKAYLLLGKWLDHAGQTQSEVIKHTFRKSTENLPRWEKGWYYLGRHYNRLLDSERSMPPDKQNQTYLTGEMAKLVIENYVRSLLNGSKYVFQTLPKILTLWFDLVANIDVTADPRRGNEQFLKHQAAQRKRVIDDVNSHIKKYIDRIQASVLYTILPQVVARICHTNKAVFEILTSIVVKVVRAFPNQALWTLLAVMKSQSKDRSSRGLTIFNKIVEAQKKTSSSAMTPSELKALITAGQRFSDEVLRVSEFPIEGKVPKVLLGRDLGFNHKIAPSKLVVPSESCLIPSIPTSYDQAYLKSFRAFPTEPVTISAFLDEALVLASLQKPRKLSIRGSDGRIYGVLAKPKDDMRKDQRLMEFNTMINRFLKRDVEASKRRLYIRTYAVIPLNEECGLIEWVDNLKTYRDIILKLYKDKQISPNYGEIRTLLDQSCTGPPENAQVFSNQILKVFPAVFHEWFVESFPDPTAWFGARLRYTRACAVMSIVGHVLGLGDRHGENIMFEEDNGSLMHVDFNCLFDKGLTFEKPEHVPFRLTHNMVDAMGAYKYEGPFRRSSEITLQLLRSNEDALMTILETFMHDPTTDFLEKERRKKKAVPGVPNTPAEVLEGVRQKVRGFLSGESVPLSVGGYVQEMISRAVDERNLCRMYIGWCAFF